YIFAGFNVNPISVLTIPWIFRKNPTNRQIFTHKGMNAPGRRILECDPLQQNFLAMKKTNHIRTQIIFYIFKILNTNYLFEYYRIFGLCSLQGFFSGVPNLSSGSHYST